MFLDIALGAALGLLAGTVYDMTQIVQFVAGGIVFALLPDIDFIVYRLWAKRAPRFDYLHRDILHKPFLYIPIGASAVYAIGGVPWAVLFVAASLVHFLHDTTGVGFGIKWLWPFSTKLIGFRHSGLRDCAGYDKIPLLCAVPSDVVDAHVEQREQPEKTWIEQTYARPSKIARLEYGTLILATLILVAGYVVIRGNIIYTIQF